MSNISENTFIFNHNVSNIIDINFYFHPSSHSNRQNLVIDGFLFRKNKSTNKNIYFICSEKTCKTRVTLKSDLTRIISPPYPNHSHEPADQQLKEKQFNEKVNEEMKKKSGANNENGVRKNNRQIQPRDNSSIQ